MIVLQYNLHTDTQHKKASNHHPNLPLEMYSNLHCNHLGNTWKPLVLMNRHFDYCPRASEGDNQSVRSSAPVVSRCFAGGYNVKLYISNGRLAWWLLAFLHSDILGVVLYSLGVFFFLLPSRLTLGCDKVSMLTHTYPQKTLGRLKWPSAITRR